NMVLITPSTLHWSTSAAGTATVDATGKVTGVAAGPVTITATETESSVSASLPLTILASVPSSTLPQSVAYQINSSHSGSISFGQPLSFPAQPTWSVALGGKTSYPLIVGGRVFVTATNPSGGYGTSLYALDLATGHTAWGPVALGGTY